MKSTMCIFILSVLSNFVMAYVTGSKLPCLDITSSLALGAIMDITFSAGWYFGKTEED